MRALDDAEARMQCRLPRGFRKTYETKPVLTGITDWEIFEPEELFRTPAEDDAPIPGVAIGRDVGGNTLLLRFDAKGSLGEALFMWNHDGGAIEHEADSLEALFEKDSEDEEEDEDDEEGPYERADADPDAGGVCAHCKSGMDGGRICPVCGRRAGTKPEPDAAEC